MGACDAAEQRAQHQPAERNDGGDREDGLADGKADPNRFARVIGGTERADSEQDGDDARSWNNRIAKAVRPVGVLRRFSSARTWIATAVEDIARARPMTMAVFQV